MSWVHTMRSGLEAPELSAAFEERRFGTEEIGTSREAAVLVLLLGETDPDLVLIERSATMRKHAGQVAFPGGAIEPGESPVEAALREAYEEVRLDPSLVTVLGQLPAARIPVSSFHVHAVVGMATEVTLEAQAGEVAAVRRVGVRTLASPTTRTSWRHESGRTGPGFVVGDLYVWGFTAYVVDAVLAAGGWAEPWDAARFTEIPQRFRR